MALQLADRVRETTSTVGTGAVTLGGAVSGYVAFSSVITNGNTTYYVIVTTTGASWEVGVGTYSSGTLTRNTVLDSSNSNALVNFQAGTKYVFIAQPAGRAVYSNGTNIVSADGVPVSVIGGGTGFTSYTTGDIAYASGTTALSKLSIGTAGQVITSTGTAPQWSSSLTVTGITDSGNLTFTGTGNRITGDFSNATVASRVMFQTSTVNGSTNVYAIPNGTGTTSTWTSVNNSDPTNAGVFQLAATSTDARLVATITGTGTYLPMTFYTGGSERVRITASGNIEIGQAATAAATSVGQYSASGYASTYRFYQTGIVEMWMGVKASVNALSFGTGAGTSTELMRIDSSGNVGIGTSSPAGKLEVSSATNIVYSTGTAGFGAFYARGSGTNSSYLFLGNATSGEQGRITVENGGAFIISNTASVTERMRIDSSGNVGIGTTSPSYKLDITGQGRATTGFAVSADGSTFTPSGLNAIPNYGVGYITSESQTTLSGFGGIPFYTNQVERMRIDSSGNLLVGTTSSLTNGLSVVTNGNTGIGYFRNLATSGITSDQIQIAVAQAASSAYYLIRSYTSVSGSPAVQFAVRGDGVVYAQNTTIQSLSDQRLKENIVDSTDGLEVITALRPRRFDWKTGFGNDKKNQLGFVAQEVEAVFPDAVDVWHMDDANTEEYKSVGAGALIPVLVKAIQEQQALITSLTARIVALETKGETP